MPRITYGTTSPYFTTPQSSFFLEYFNYRNIPLDGTDIFYIIQPQYQYRPDLLASVVYNDSNLWWVFTNTNLNQIQDPIWDFVAGLEIRYPTKQRINNIIR